MAQSSNVFSVNIVGYVNVVAKGNGAFTLIANPLNAATNDLNTIAAGIPNKSTAQIWNGSGFNGCNEGWWCVDPEFDYHSGNRILRADAGRKCRRNEHLCWKRGNREWWN